MPPYIYLDTNNIKKSNVFYNQDKTKSTKEKMSEFLEQAMKNGKSIALGIQSLIDKKMLSTDAALKLQKKLFVEKVKPINIVLLGSICEKPKLCEKFLMALKDVNKVDFVLDNVRENLLKKK